MKKLIFLFLLMLTPAFALGGDNVINAPVFEEAEFWEFELKVTLTTRSDMPNGTYKVVFKENRLQMPDYDKPNTLNANIPTVPGLGKNPPWFRFPLKEGDSWTHEQSRRSTNFPFFTFSVGKVEKITVKAGTFNATKITLIRAGPKSRNETTYFYSDETKSVVRASAEYSSGTQYHVELLRHGKGL